MKYFFIIFLVLVGFAGTVFAQSMDNADEGKSGILVATTNNVRYNVPYDITSGTVNGITPVCDSAYAMVLFASDKPGKLVLDIPRSLLDAKNKGTDDEFFVLLNGTEIDFGEASNAHSREIAIQFDPGSYELEVITPWGLSLDSKRFACKIVHNPPYSYILPPLKQPEHTTDIHEIVCKDSQQLIFKKDVWSPACVNENSVSKLIKRGWAAKHDPAHTDMMVATDNRAIKNEWTASYYLNYLPLPNGEVEENTEKVILWNMLDELEKHGIENWRNDPDIGAHTDEGWMNPSRMCSKIFLEDGTGHFVSAEFYSEPELNITKITIDDLRPADCQKWFWIPYEIKLENGIMIYKYEKLIETKPQTTNN